MLTDRKRGAPAGMIFTFLCLFLFGTLAPTAVAQTSRRSADRATDTVFQAIGIVENLEVNGQATGTLVSRCHVLTAAHVLRGRIEEATARATRLGSLRFLIGPPSGNRPFERTIVARPVAWGDHKLDRSPDNWREDWLLLKLDECAGEMFRPIQLSPLSYDKARDLEDRVLVAGFPQDNEGGTISYNAGCSLAFVPDQIVRMFGNYKVWSNDCIELPGISGAGLLYIDESAALRLFGLQVGRELYPGLINFPGNLGLSIPVEHFYARIEPVIQKDRISDGRGRMVKLVNKEEEAVIYVHGKSNDERALGGFPMNPQKVDPGRSAIVNFEDYSGNCLYHVHVTLEIQGDRHLGGYDVCQSKEIIIEPTKP